jgi:hypothetical protein
MVDEGKIAKIVLRQKKSSDPQMWLGQPRTDLGIVFGQKSKCGQNRVEIV